MQIRVVVLLVFILFALIIFPVAILLQSHLYADGAAFFARTIESGRWNQGSAYARIGQHFLTQASVGVAMKIEGISIISLSWIYGAALFYFPMIGFALAAWLFLRAKMLVHAVLVTLMFCVLQFTTSFFIISESHLATGLFMLTLAVITTCDLSSRRVRTALVILWILSASIYEYWAIFFPVCLAVLVIRNRKPVYGSMPKWSLMLFAMLYVLGAGLNVYSILFTQFTVNRDAMFSSQLASIWKHLVPYIVLFVIPLLWSAAIVRADKVQTSSPLPWHANALMKVRRLLEHPLITLLLGLGTAIGIFTVVLFKTGTPCCSYALRTLNLFLPLLFVVFLVAFPEKAQTGTVLRMKHRRLIPILLAMLFLSAFARIFHSLGFHSFQERLFRVTQSNTGYVTLEDALPGEQNYGWFWTYPTMSLLVQVMRGTPVKSVIHDPGLEYQPFDPDEFDRVRAFESIIFVPDSTGEQVN